MKFKASVMEWPKGGWRLQSTKGVNELHPTAEEALTAAKKLRAGRAPLNLVWIPTTVLGRMIVKATTGEPR